MLGEQELFAFKARTSFHNCFYVICCQRLFSSVLYANFKVSAIIQYMLILSLPPPLHPSLSLIYSPFWNTIANSMKCANINGFRCRRSFLECPQLKCKQNNSQTFLNWITVSYYICTNNSVYSPLLSIILYTQK